MHVVRSGCSSKLGNPVAMCEGSCGISASRPTRCFGLCDGRYALLKLAYVATERVTVASDDPASPFA